MVCRRGGRVAAVIAGDEKDVFGPEGVHDLGEPRIHCLEGTGIALRVVPVAVKGVQVNQVGEDKALFHRGQGLESQIDALVVRGGMHFLGEPLVHEYVAYLADAHGLLPCGSYQVEERFRRRRRGKIPSRRHPLERARPSCKGPCYDPADVVFVCKEPGLLAYFIELREREHAVVRRYLEDAVSRGIDDELACFKVLFPEALYYLGA